MYQNKKKKCVYFRADGNADIATGHLMRCLSVADACVSLSMDVCFLLSDAESAALLAQFDPKGRFPYQILGTAVYNQPEKELDELCSILQYNTQAKHPSDADFTISNGGNFANNPESTYDIHAFCLFIDSYFVTENYLRTLNELCPVAYMDDLQLFDYPVSLVINYDVMTAKTQPRYEAAYRNAKKTLLGSSYTPLRRQFADCTPVVRPSVSDILVTTGGSDPYHFALKAARALSSAPLCLHILLGAYHPDRDELLRLSEELPFLTLHEAVTDMAGLMAQCDLAISAAGTTLFELCAAGVPAISYTFADNQMPAAEAFAAASAIPYAGDLRTDADAVVSSVLGFVTHMSHPTVESTTLSTSSSSSCEMTAFSLRKQAQLAERALVDGKGALRIADALSSLLKSYS